MTIFFRVDCGALYGLGHALRCRTLAQAIHAQAPDMPLAFVTTTPELQKVLRDKGDAWRVEVSGAFGEDHWLHWLKKHAQTRDVLIVDAPDRLNDAAWITRIRETQLVVRIDAPWATPETCDLLILPGMHHSAETIECLDTAFGERLMVGAEYVMLQEGVTLPMRLRLPYGERIPPWIVFNAGGSDPEGALPQLWQRVRRLGDTLSGIQRVYCMGQTATPWPVSQLSPDEWITGHSMRYVQHAQLFITLWGTTVYEAVALGTPTLAIARTEAEAEDAARLEAATDGAVQSLGTLVGLMRETLCDRLVALWEDGKERKRMHYASAGLLDGKGAERVARAVVALTG